MPRGKKNPDPAAAGPVDGAEPVPVAAEVPTEPATGRARGRTGSTNRTRGRRAVGEAVVAVGVEAGGVPVAGPGPSAVAVGLQTTVLQEQLTELQRQLAEITRQAHDAR